MKKPSDGASISSQELVIDWFNWVLRLTLVGIGLLVLFWRLDLDQRLALYLSQQPGGFPYAASSNYEYIFHKIPKVISGSVFIGMLLLAVFLLPWCNWFERIYPAFLCQRLQLPIIAKPRVWLRRFPAGTAASLWVTILAMVFAAEMIGHLKRASSVDCPIKIQVFGGHKVVALSDIHEPFPHFGEGGHCWPGGHSITGFLFVACFFGFKRMGMNKAARISLIVALVYGNFLGLTQVLRGQHYLSHQLWSAYLVWVFSLIFFIFFGFLQRFFSKTRSE